MPKVRKKPVVIEATQWFKNGDHPEDNCGDFYTEESGHFKGEGSVVRYYRTPDCDGQTPCKHCGDIMHNHGWIDTREGGHIVCPGDFIITDVRVADPMGHGHFYPCKPAIFSATYEAVSE